MSDEPAPEPPPSKASAQQAPTPLGLSRADLTELGWSTADINTFRAHQPASPITRRDRAMLGWPLDAVNDHLTDRGEAPLSEDACRSLVEQSVARQRATRKTAEPTSPTKKRRPKHSSKSRKKDSRAASSRDELNDLDYEMFYALKDGVYFNDAAEAAREGYISTTAIKRRPGWTDTAIEKFLRANAGADALCVNPHGGRHPMRLYAHHRVIAVEQTAEFQDWATKSLKRRGITPEEVITAQAETLLRDADRAAKQQARDERAEQDAAQAALAEAEQITAQAAHEHHMQELARTHPVFRHRDKTWVIEGTVLTPGTFIEVPRRDGTTTIVRVAEIVGMNADVMVASFTRHQPKPGDHVIRT